MKVFRFSDRLSYLILTISIFIFIVPFANLGFDWIHEGVNVSSALGIKSGAVVHRDIIEMKGLLFPTYLALMTGFNTFNSIVYMKLANVLLVALSASLFYFAYSDKVKKMGLMISLIWILSNPITSNFVYGGPHGILFISPNLITVTLILMILALETKSRNFEKLTQSYFNLLIVLLAGLLPWIRFQNLFFSLGIIAFITFRTAPKASKLLSLFTVFALSLFSPLYYLHYTNADADWLVQIVKIPFTLSQIADSSVYMPVKIVFKTTLVCLIFFFLYLLTIYLMAKKSNFKYFFTAILILCFPVALWASTTYSIDDSKRFNLMNWFLIIAGNLPLSLSRAAIFLPFLSIFLAFYKLTVKQIPGKSNKEASNKYAASSFEQYIPSLLAGFQGLLFLYPNFGNLWEITLLLFISLTYFLKVAGAKYLESMSKVLVPVVLGLILTSSYNALTIWTTPKYAYTSPLLSGIFETDERRTQQYDQVMSSLSELRGNLLNECNLPLLSFPGGEYRSISKFHVNAVYRKVVSLESVQPETVVICSNIESGFDLSNYSLSSTTRLESGVDVSLYTKQQALIKKIQNKS